MVQCDDVIVLLLWGKLRCLRDLQFFELVALREARRPPGVCASIAMMRINRFLSLSTSQIPIDFKKWNSCFCFPISDTAVWRIIYVCVFGAFHLPRKCLLVNVTVRDDQCPRFSKRQICIEISGNGFFLLPFAKLRFGE